MARPEEQMIGVAEDDLGVYVIQEIASQHALDGCLGAHRHEHRGLDIPVRGVQNPGSGPGFGADRLKLEREH